MSAPVRLVAFAVVVVLGLGGGYALGAAVGPFEGDTTPAHEMTSTTVPATASTLPDEAHEQEHGS